MGSLGYLLLAAFVVAAYAAGSPWLAPAARRRWSRAGRRVLHARGDHGRGLHGDRSRLRGGRLFNQMHVQRVSDSAQPLFYKLTACWGGLDGSIMFWVTLLRSSDRWRLAINRERHRELIPSWWRSSRAWRCSSSDLMIVHNNPFGTFLTENPADGASLSPLLQNFLMVIHPPTMYWKRRPDHSLRLRHGGADYGLPRRLLAAPVRRWTMIAWLFLSFGLGLGMVWAYEELGWGGYWMWDPVENAGLLPVHGHRVPALGDGQERRGMLRCGTSRSSSPRSS